LKYTDPSGLVYCVDGVYYFSSDEEEMYSRNMTMSAMDALISPNAYPDHHNILLHGLLYPQITNDPPKDLKKVWEDFKKSGDAEWRWTKDKGWEKFKTSSVEFTQTGVDANKNTMHVGTVNGKSYTVVANSTGNVILVVSASIISRSGLSSNAAQGGGGHDGMDYVNAFVGAAGSYFGLTGNMFHNELYWVQKNGTLRSTQMLNNSNKIYRTSYNVVKESFATAKVWSNRMATLGLITTGIDIAVDGQIRPSHMVNLTMAGISYTGVGSLVAGGYWITDMGFEVFTGYSLGDRLDQWLDPQHGASGSW
jgi:hypothetical protein